MKITSPLVVIFITAVFLFLAATNIQGGWLYVLDALLWSAVLLAFVVPFLQLRRLTVRRQLPDAPLVGVTQTLTLSLENGSRLPVMFLNLEELPVFSLRQNQALTLNTDKHFSVWTAAGQKTEFYTRFRPEVAGVYVFKGFQIGSFGPLGLMGVYWKQRSPAAWVVYPVPPESGLNILPEGLIQQVQQARRRSHLSEDISHFREYQTGDSRNAIHWKNTARQARLIVAEAREEPFQQAQVIFDTAKTTDLKAFDALLRTTEAVCQGLLAQQMEVACWAPNADPEFWRPYQIAAPLRQQAGVRQWEGLQYWLATLAPDALLSLEESLAAAGPQAEHAVLILISSVFPSAESLRNLLMRQSSGSSLLVYTLESNPLLPEEWAGQVVVKTIVLAD
ncbi:MAG: DUF58 domain-containing protein [Candidatus Sericytochromatia bacterium]